MLINPDNFLTINSSVSSRLQPWITYQTSLTEKLKKIAGDADLQLLKQVWEQADWWDKHVLKIANEQVMHREIVMCAKKKPCWYARTVIPQTTYSCDTVFFDRLENESLGKLIFEGNKVKRFMLMNYSINPSCIEYYWLTEWMHRHETELWVRLSGFTVSERFSFFLVEILLPELARYTN